MNTKTTLLLLAAALTFASPAARAQFPGGGFQGGGFQGGGFGSGGFGGSQIAAVKPTWMSNRVSLNVKSVTVAQAAREVLDKAGVKNYTLFLSGGPAYLVKDGQLFGGQSEENFARPYANPVTLTAQSVTAEDALKRIASAAGVEFSFRTEDNQLTVMASKTAAGFGTVYTIGSQLATDLAVVNALKRAQKAAGNVQMFLSPNATDYRSAYSSTFLRSGATLPDTRVKLDVRGGDVRDALQNVLKQANLDYALEDDVPESPKRSFTFENVPVATALDVLCKSADIGWRAETHGGKTLVRVGKKYVSPPIAPFAGFYPSYVQPQRPPALRLPSPARRAP